MFGFPAQSKADNFRFPNNLLKSVTFQLKYNATKDVSAETSALVTALLPTFPVVKQIKRARLEAEVQSGRDVPQVNSEIKPSGLQFSVDDNSKVFVINDEAVTMTFSGVVYTTFAESYSEYIRIIKIIEPILFIESFYRAAIRKINGIQCEMEQNAQSSEQPWLSVMNDVFAPDLLASLNLLPGNEYILSNLVNSRFSKGDYRLNLIYGIPAKEIKPDIRQVVLDIDMSNVAKDISLEAVDDIFLSINNEVFNIFMWAVKSEFLDMINQ